MSSKSTGNSCPTAISTSPRSGLTRALFLFFIPFLISKSLHADFLTYSTNGHPKAQGVEFSIDYPTAWIPKDNPQPGIVHEFRAPTTGGRDALIIVVPSSQPKKATPKKFRDSFQLPEAQETIMPKALHRKKEFLDDLSYPCVVFDYDLQNPKLEPSVIQVRNYILLIGDKMVQIQFYGVAPPSEDIRSSRKDMMDHVVRSIKNSKQISSSRGKP